MLRGSTSCHAASAGHSGRFTKMKENSSQIVRVCLWACVRACVCVRACACACECECVGNCIRLNERFADVHARENCSLHYKFFVPSNQCYWEKHFCDHSKCLSSLQVSLPVSCAGTGCLSLFLSVPTRVSPSVKHRRLAPPPIHFHNIRYKVTVCCGLRGLITWQENNVDGKAVQHHLRSLNPWGLSRLIKRLYLADQKLVFLLTIVEDLNLFSQIN